MDIVGMKFIYEWMPPYTLSTFTSIGGIAALYHEVADDPMKLKSRGEKCQSGYRWVHYMANHVPMQSCMNRHGSDACC